MKHTVAICVTLIIIALIKYAAPVAGAYCQMRALEAIVQLQAHGKAKVEQFKL